MHLQGLIHRDIKPENILLRDQNDEKSIVIADFGLATYYNNVTNVLFKRCGTPGYVAPEILTYEDNLPFYDDKCDVFSIGVLMYLLLSGKQPFTGDNYKVILKANKEC